MMRKHLQVVSFVDVHDLVPDGWSGSFWGAVSENAPFSWGDNNLSLVTASAFKDHVLRTLDPAEAEVDGEHLLFDFMDVPVLRKEFEAFIAALEALGTGYVNLECAGAYANAQALRYVHADITGILQARELGLDHDLEAVRQSLRDLEAAFPFLATETRSGDSKSSL